MTIKTVVGRTGGVPEVRVTQGGKSVATFSVAETKRKFDRDSNQWVDDFTIWHNVEAWKNTNALSMLPKGSLVIVVGEERDGSYENREGRKVARIVVRASDVGTVLLDTQGSAPTQQQAAQEPWSTPTSSDEPWGGQW